MSDTETEHFRRMQERYRRREMPWDHQLPPPEIMAAAERLAAGTALDLGCGTARAGIYLAARGWTVDGVDFVPEALELAAARVAEAGLAGQVRLHTGSVTSMPFLAGPYDLAIDVGCVHGLDAERQRAYAAEVARLVRPGGTYLLFVHLREPGQEDGRPGTPDGSVEALFGETFEFASVTPGTTTVGEDTWRSAWYELRRTENREPRTENREPRTEN